MLGRRGGSGRSIGRLTRKFVAGCRAGADRPAQRGQGRGLACPAGAWLLSGASLVGSQYREHREGGGGCRGNRPCLPGRRPGYVDGANIRYCAGGSAVYTWPSANFGKTRLGAACRITRRKAYSSSGMISLFGSQQSDLVKESSDRGSALLRGPDIHRHQVHSLHWLLWAYNICCKITDLMPDYLGKTLSGDERTKSCGQRKWVRDPNTKSTVLGTPIPNSAAEMVREVGRGPSSRRWPLPGLKLRMSSARPRSPRPAPSSRTCRSRPLGPPGTAADAE